MVQQNKTKNNCNNPTAQQRQATTSNKHQAPSNKPFTTPHHPYSQGNTKANCAASLLSSHSKGGTNGISLSLRVCGVFFSLAKSSRIFLVRQMLNFENQTK